MRVRWGRVFFLLFLIGGGIYWFRHRSHEPRPAPPPPEVSGPAPQPVPPTPPDTGAGTTPDASASGEVPPGETSSSEAGPPSGEGTEPAPSDEPQGPPAEERPLRALQGPAAIRTQTITLTAGGKRYAVQVARVRLDSARLVLGLAGRRVGTAESLADIAKRYGAVTAINGSYFDAYTSGPVKVPHHTLIAGGEVVHKGNIGTLLGFTADSFPNMGRLPLKIIGALDGSYKHPDNWWAYWLNRLPSTPDTAILFTPHWGQATGVADGVQITVSGGRIAGIGGGSQRIPRDGFVLYLRGRETSLLDRLTVGRACEYRVVREDGSDLGDWKPIQEAVGAGPRLLTDGEITVDPGAEAFSHEKILTLSASRSMAGLTDDGWLILATSTGTVREMADVMKALGARDAMSLDGGASSGLWVRGRYLTTPGRLISNALLVLNP